MALIVKKFGGSSVGTTEKILNVAKRIIAEKQPGDQIVMVVSAMGDTTDELIELAKQINPNPYQYTREMDMLIKKYKPDVMGVEQLFFNRNVTTAIPVGQARGVVLLAAAKNGLELVERTPLQVKQSVTGYGKATKEQVIYMVTKLLNLPEPPKPDDVADALAVAICTSHVLNSFTYRNKI